MYISFLKRRILFSFVCILACIWNVGVLNAQNTPSSEKETADHYFAKAKKALQSRDTETALPLIYKADSLYQKLAFPEEIIETKLLEYRCFHFLKPISEWSTPLYQALSFEKKLEKPSMTKVKLYAALSTNASLNNQSTVAYYYGSKALSLLQGEHLTKDPEYQAFYMSILYRMGKTEERQYNYKKAENFYSQSLEKARKHELPFYLSYGGLFKTYTLTNQHQKIIEMVEEFEAEKYAQSQPAFFVYDFYSYHIDYLIKNSLYDKAMKQSLALKKLRNTDKFKSHFYEWFLSERIADIHNFQGNHQEAINELLSTKALQESLEIRNVERAALLIKLAKYYLNLNDYKNAQYYSEEALTVNTQTQRDTTAFHMPLDLDNINKAHKNILLDNLLFKAQLAEKLYTKTKNNSYLETKKQSYTTAHELIKRMGKLSDEDAFLDETQFKNVYGNLMQLYQQEWQTNKDQKTFDSALELRLQSQYVTILNELKDAQQRKDIDSIPFIKNSRATYKGYNKIYYFWGQDAIYVLHENNTIQHFDEIPLTTQLEEAIDIVSTEVRKIDTIRNHKAHQLIYEKLLEKYIHPDLKTAVLLDDKLHLIPMSSLWITAEKQYLLDKTSIIHITTALPTKETSQSEKALLMAPFATHEGIFNNRLAKSADEINAITPYFNHTTYLDQQATKNVFLDQLATSSIIHLATHAIANTEDPLLSTIQFYEEASLDPTKTSLTLPEIYDLNLNADLVTLSACETGIGKEIKGKGVQSMANAFTHAGAASTVMSLWKVPDTETTTIMAGFYNYLHKGMPKDEALRQAKLAYINSQKDYPALQHPYYWSGFVISGNPKTIQHQELPWEKWGLILGGAFILLLLFKKPLFQLIKK